MTMLSNLALAFAAVASPLPEIRHTTAHYDLRIEGTEGEAEAFGRILEASWPTFRGFFHGEPPLSGDARLVIRLFDTSEACLVGAMDDKADMPPKKHPAWFSPGNGVVYLHRASSDWCTRYLLIYGACLQFHGLAKSKNRDLDEWYTHGIAESFAVHTWDGEKLDLGASPPICDIDHAAQAMDRLGGKQIGLDPFTDERLEDQFVRWAVVRFATSASGGRYRERFEKLALGATGSKLSGHDFMRSLGQEQRIAQEFSVWLLSNQMPLEEVTPGWEGFADGRVVGISDADSQVLCAAKSKFTVLRAEVDVPSEPRAPVPGVLLSVRDDRNYDLARIVPPMLFVHHVEGGKQLGIESKPIPASGPTLHVSVARSGDGVDLEVGGSPCGRFRVPAGRLGLAVVGGTATFRSVQCR